MSSTLLEVTRSAHEDVERLERLIVRELQREPANNRDRLFQSHRVRHMIDVITSTTEKLVSSCAFSLWFPLDTALISFDYVPVLCFLDSVRFLYNKLVSNSSFERLIYTRTRTMRGEMRLRRSEGRPQVAQPISSVRFMIVLRR